MLRLCSPSPIAGITGFCVYPTAPSDMNHAMRRKPKPPGSTGGLGGDGLAVTAT